MHDIRQGDSYRNRREELEDLGVTFYSHKNPRGRSLSAAVPESAHTPVALDVVPLEIELDPLFGSQSLLRLHGQQKVVSKGDGLVHFTGVQVGQEPGTEGSQRGQNGIIAYPQISSNIGSTDNDYPPVHVFHPRTDLSHDKPRTNSGIGIETKSVSGSSISVGDINQNRSQCQVSSFQEGDTGSSNISHCILSTGSDTCAPSQSQSHNQSQGHNYLSKKDDKGSTDTEDCVVVLV